MSDLPQILDQGITESQRFRKPNSGLVLIPKSGQLRTVERKLFNALLFSAQKEIVQKNLLAEYNLIFVTRGEQEAEKHLDALAGTHRFEMKYSALAPIIAGSKLSRKELESYLLGLRGTDVIFMPPELKPKKDQRLWAASGLIEVPQLEMRDETIWITWKLSADMFRDVGDPTLYTLVDLEYQRQLSSYAAVALYEICLRYKNNDPDVGTGFRPPEWWATALSRKALVPTKRKKKDDVDEVHSEPKVRDWAKIKFESLTGRKDKPSEDGGKLKAIDEINEKTDIRITLDEKVEGRKIVGVRFLIERKDKNVGRLGTDAISPELLERVTRVNGLSIDAVKGALKTGKSELEIFAALNQLDNRLARTDLAPVENVTAFWRSLLEGNQRHITYDKPQEAPAKKTGEGAPISEEANLRRVKVEDALGAMPADELDAYCEAVFERFSPQLQNSLAKLRAAKTWSHPLIWAHVRKAKGEELFGPDWQTTDPQGAAA